MDLTQWMKKNIFVQLKTRRYYSGEIIEIEEENFSGAYRRQSGLQMVSLSFHRMQK